MNVYDFFLGDKKKIIVVDEEYFHFYIDILYIVVAYQLIHIEEKKNETIPGR